MKLLSHPLLLQYGHEEHSESPKRLRTLLQTIENVDLTIGRRATVEELGLVHTKRYIDSVLSGNHVDPEMEVTESTVEAALVAAGLGIELIEQLVAGKITTGFALVRPPGHHAEPDRGMGYCIFNNLAIAAKKALALGVERILVIDWDVHYANGTQKALCGDERILFFDIHQENLYPIGSGPASIPLKAGSGDKEYLDIFETIIKPKIHSFCPELILVSAGYDAHESDPHGFMKMTTEGFGRLAKELYGSKVILFLEGGYNDYYLVQNVLATVRALHP